MDTTAAADVAALLTRYLISLDNDELDDTWAAELFTQDATVDFPVSRHVGTKGMADWHAESLNVFERTQHLPGPAEVTVDGDTARLRATLISTHVHRKAPEGAGPLFTTGTGVFARAARTAAGWRLSALEFRLVWMDGKPPGAAAA